MKLILKFSQNVSLYDYNYVYLFNFIDTFKFEMIYLLYFRLLKGNYLSDLVFFMIFKNLVIKIVKVLF